MQTFSVSQWFVLEFTKKGKALLFLSTFIWQAIFSCHRECFQFYDFSVMVFPKALFLDLCCLAYGVRYSAWNDCNLWIPHSWKTKKKFTIQSHLFVSFKTYWGDVKKGEFLKLCENNYRSDCSPYPRKLQSYCYADDTQLYIPFKNHRNVFHLSFLLKVLNECGAPTAESLSTL